MRFRRLKGHLSMPEVTHHPWIRPSPEYLRTLPTLEVLTPQNVGKATARFCRTRGCDFRLELKLVTPRARFWLIAHCVGEPFPAWEEGKVCVEGLEVNNSEREPVPYGSADLKWLQRFDYIDMLRAEIAELLEAPWSRDTNNRIREVRAEAYKLMKGSKFKFKELEDGSIVVGDPKSPPRD
jgi:hypothetical protein